MNKEKDNKAWDKLVNSICGEDEIKACKSSSEVRSVLRKWLQGKYKGQMHVGKINAVADDLAESVCLKLGIDDRSVK